MPDVRTQLGDLALQVYNTIASAGWEGKTVDEIEVLLDKSHQSVSARVHELARWKPKPLIEARKAMRATRTGRKAYIYVLAGLKQANNEDARTTP